MEPFPTGLILAGRSFCQDLCVVPTQPKLHFPKLTLAGSHNPQSSGMIRVAQNTLSREFNES